MDTQDVYISGLPANGSLQTMGCIQDINFVNLDQTTHKKVSYTVKCNGHFVIEEILDLYPGVLVKIGLKDLLQYVFDFTPPDIFDPHIQLSSNIKEIDIALTVGAERTYCYFWLINNRMENIDPVYFYQSNFSTFQPRSKTVQWQDAEVLTFYSSKEGQELCCRATNNVQYETVTLAATRFGLVNLAVKFDKLVERFSISDISEFYFYLSGYDDPDRFGQKYVMSHAGPRNTSVFYFENTAGGFDCLRAYGICSDKNKITTKVSQRDKRTVAVNVTSSEAVKVNSGYLTTREQRRFIKDFFLSPHKYLLEDGELVEILVSEANANGNWFEAANFSFEYSKVFARPEKSPRHSSFLLPVNETAKLQLSTSFIEIHKDGMNTTLHFQRDHQLYSFPSTQNYEVVISDRIQSIAVDLSVDKYTDRIVLNFGAVQTDTTAIGIISILDKLTGEEAVAIIDINC